MHEEHSVVNLREPKHSPPPPPPIPERPVPRPAAAQKPRFVYSRPLVVTLALLILVPLIIGLYLHPPFGAKSNSAEGAGDAAQTEDVIARVGALIELPGGEVPTVATVTDPGKLQDQVFFAKAKKGDQVLIYTQARKAYLYDPIHNKLREVAPITTQ